MRRLLVASIALLSFVSMGTYAGQTCNDVYASAVGNVSVNARRLSENSYTYNKYCSSTGELSESSAGLDLTIPVKGILVGFSGSKEDAKTVMSEFCREHYGESSAIGQMYQFEKEVVVDALRSYNQCRALEVNNVYISHQVQEPRSVIISVGFNPAQTNLFLRAVTYDPAVASCRSTGLTSDGIPTNITEDMSETQMQKTFSIVCDRIGEDTKSGMKRFPRFTVGVDTNHGAYTVTMPVEEMLGFDLASNNERRYVGLTSKLTALQREKEVLKNAKDLLQNSKDLLQTRIDNAGVEIHLVSQGKNGRGVIWEHVACPQHGGNLEAYVANKCGSRKSVMSPLLQVHPGDTCGYHYYAYVCLSL